MRIEDVDWDSTIGAYMKAVDIPDGGVTLTIAGVEPVEVRDNKARRDDALKQAWAVHWREAGWKPWLLNTTSKKTLRALCGERIGDAIGRAITLYHDPTVSLGSAKVGGIRIAGAPWLDRDLTITIQPNPRKRPETVVLRRTGGRPAPEPERTPDVSIEDWAQSKGYPLAAVEAALAAGGKPSVKKVPARARAKAIEWLEGEGKALLADSINLMNSNLGE
jgi:hypothetical protein